MRRTSIRNHQPLTPRRRVVTSAALPSFLVFTSLMLNGAWFAAVSIDTIGTRSSDAGGEAIKLSRGGSMPRPTVAATTSSSGQR